MHATAITTRAGRTRPEVDVRPQSPPLGLVTVRWFLASQVFLTLGWIGILEVFGSLGHWTYVCMVAAFAFVFAACQATDGPSKSGRAHLAVQAAVLVMAAWLLPFPASLPLWLLAMAAGCASALAPVKEGRRAAMAFLVLGLTSMIQGLAALGIGYVWLRARYWPLFNRLADYVLS